MRTLIEKLRRRPAPRPIVTDWTTGWSLRDLADLPTHHPRQNER